MQNHANISSHESEVILIYFVQTKESACVIFVMFVSDTNLLSPSITLVSADRPDEVWSASTRSERDLGREE